jgi:basic membrane protein A
MMINKRIGAWIVVGAVFSLLIGCQAKDKTDRTMDDGLVSAVLVTEGMGIDDRSFNASAWRGMMRFINTQPYYTQNMKESLIKTIHASGMDQIENSLSLASDELSSLVVGAGFQFADPMRRVAQHYPAQYFLLVDAAIDSLPNVRSTVFSEYEGAYLAGVAIALKALQDGIDNPSFGFLGGMETQVTIGFLMGFRQGLLSVLPQAPLRSFYAGSWGAPEIGKTKAREWFDTGVYAIFAAAGGTGSGVIAQAKEHRLDGHDVWVIGVDSDQYDDGIYGEEVSVVFTSVLKLVENAVYDSLILLEHGQFSGGVVQYNLANNGVGLSTRHESYSPAIAVAVSLIADKIISGEIVVAHP